MSAHADDPEKMARMRTWLATVEKELDLDDTVLSAAETPLLDMISSVAHGPSRPGAPLTAFLVGVAAGRGADATELAERINQLALSVSR